ncbi:NUMOD4 domain-containing protein [Neobacillus ginsengisoli]|uniref:HNH endonuclease n=1 Tax=Neobacillus ginsengisoli TaxID=904295 RepID=A0ABT9XQW1_9BACI|nr:NUMOD4 domain-containing protein [Neobacillus ginsengisoli]MDQ0197947.1 hypothetical protein [Neobacillus ginsengisoli]
MAKVKVNKGMAEFWNAPEEWRDVVGYEGKYEVSNFGEVRRILKDGETRLMSLNGNEFYNDHVSVCLTKNGVNKTIGAHRLVAEAFIPIPKKYKGKAYKGKQIDVDHFDEDKTNNCVLNLQWIPHSLNVKRSIEFKKAREKYTGYRTKEDLR